MSVLESGARVAVKHTIITTIRHKMQGYNPETKHMPFHTRLLSQDRMGLYSFIQSLNTKFGKSIFEPVAEIIAESNFHCVETQYSLPRQISVSASSMIDKIVGDLTSSVAETDKNEEIERIRRAMISDSASLNNRSIKADLRLVTKGKDIYLIDIKTVKPNAANFVDFKRTLLHWYAKESALYPDAQIHTAIALPYNPYRPEPYRRWTMRGMLDLRYEVYIAEEFWNFLADAEIFDDLLDCFEEAGLELRDEIDDYFARHMGSD